MPHSFNPQEFFDQTANFASAARGEFRLPALSEVACFKPVKSDARVAAGFGLLRQGLLAKSFTIPGVSLGTYEATSYVGPTTKKPYGLQFTDLTVDFYLMGKTITEAKALHYTFVTWLELIAGPRHMPDADHSVRSDSTYFSVEYYDNYNTSGIVSVYSPSSDPDKPLIKIEYTELYPVAIGPLHTSWESKETPMSLSVTFAYHYANIQSTAAPHSSAPASEHH